jgi:hypothetical protein
MTGCGFAKSPLFMLVSEKVGSRVWDDPIITQAPKIKAPLKNKGKTISFGRLSAFTVKYYCE